MFCNIGILSLVGQTDLFHRKQFS